MSGRHAATRQQPRPPWVRDEADERQWRDAADWLAAAINDWSHDHPRDVLVPVFRGLLADHALAAHHAASSAAAQLEQAPFHAGRLLSAQMALRRAALVFVNRPGFPETLRPIPDDVAKAGASR